MGMWLPTTEAELRIAVESRLIPEGHFLDFKRELGATESSRKETAQDIASFALDGGVLIIGVHEPKSGSYELAPQPLTDLSERAEQIASNRPDPGLFVRTTVIPSEHDPDAGYLVVEVPPSPAAPHMVDGRYWGRSERTKRRLNDAEVSRLHAARTANDRRVIDAIAEELARDPEPRPESRMFFVAEPLVADDGLARAFVRGTPTAVRALAEGQEHRVPESVREHSPSPWELSSSVLRSKGIALTSLAEGRKTPTEPFLADVASDIEVQTSGCIRGVMSRRTYTDHHPRIPEGTKRVMESLPSLGTPAGRLGRVAGRAARVPGLLGLWHSPLWPRGRECGGAGSARHARLFIPQHAGVRSCDLPIDDNGELS